MTGANPSSRELPHFEPQLTKVYDASFYESQVATSLLSGAAATPEPVGPPPVGAISGRKCTQTGAVASLPGDHKIITPRLC